VFPIAVRITYFGNHHNRFGRVGCAPLEPSTNAVFAPDGGHCHPCNSLPRSRLRLRDHCDATDFSRPSGLRLRTAVPAMMASCLYGQAGTPRIVPDIDNRSASAGAWISAPSSLSQSPGIRTGDRALRPIAMNVTHRRPPSGTPVTHRSTLQINQPRSRWRVRASHPALRFAAAALGASAVSARRSSFVATVAERLNCRRGFPR